MQNSGEKVQRRKKKSPIDINVSCYIPDEYYK